MINNKDLIDENNGIWLKFEEGKNYKFEEIHAYQKLLDEKTDWNCCLSLDATYADVYIYVTKNEQGKYLNPRIYFKATHSNDQKGASPYSIYGIDEGNTIEGVMIDVLDSKLKEFQDYTDYEKKLYDMRLLYIIEQKENSGLELSRDELIFLYEFNYFIDCIGLERNKRIQKVTKNRNLKYDLAKIFECDETKIGVNIEDFSNSDIEVYYGDLMDYNVRDMLKLHFLRTVVGSVYFNNQLAVRNLGNLKYIYGDAHFDKVIDGNELHNLTYVGSDLYLNNIDMYSQLEKLEYVGGNIIFHNVNKNEKILVRGLYK